MNKELMIEALEALVEKKQTEIDEISVEIEATSSLSDDEKKKPQSYLNGIFGQ